MLVLGANHCAGGLMELITYGRFTTSAVIASAGLFSTNALAEDAINAGEFQSRWGGLYGGINFGVGDLEAGGIFDSVDAGFDNSALSQPGALAGGQVGWAIDRGDWLIGIQGDITGLQVGQAADDKAGKLHSLDSNYIASLQARAGVPLGDSLIFGSAGVAYLDADVSTNVTTTNETFQYDAFGGVFGAGLETFLSSNLSLRSEALFYTFGKSLDLSSAADSGSNSSFTINDGFKFSVGLSYHM